MTQRGAPPATRRRIGAVSGLVTFVLVAGWAATLALLPSRFSWELT